MIRGNYDHELILPKSLVNLQIEGKYNGPLNIPETLEVLYIGSHNDHELILPGSLCLLSIGPNYNKPLTLPESLESFDISGTYTHDLVLPTRLKNLSIGGGYTGDGYTGELNLPESLYTLSLFSPVQPTNWPKSLKSVFVYKQYPFELPESTSATRVIRARR